MASRLVSRTLEDQSWIMSPMAGVPVALVTVPETVTLALRVAIAGFTDVIATDIGGTAARAWPGWPGSRGRACPLPDAAAGAAASMAAATTAASARSLTPTPWQAPARGGPVRAGTPAGNPLERPPATPLERLSAIRWERPPATPRDAR